MYTQRHRLRSAGAVVLTTVLVVGGLTIWGGDPLRIHRLWASPGAADTSDARSGLSVDSFPALDDATLSPNRTRVLSVLRTEYRTQPGSAKYTGGNDEPWCADFASWVLHSAGVGVRNPNSGGWRVPGVLTLQQALVAADRFRPAGSGYAPRPGDVLLYDKPNPFGQHTNFFLARDRRMVVTVGGNEPGGIRVARGSAIDQEGFLGYGQID